MARIKYYNKQTGQWEYADNALISGSTSAVEYVEQELTEEQKEQARENIGAITTIAKDNIDMNGFKITNLPLPTTGSEPATKEFVENFTVEGSTYVATDDNNDGNVVLRPYVADVDELEFRDHINNKENPHEVTFEQIGAAPTGYGLGNNEPETLRTLTEVENFKVNGWRRVSLDSGNIGGSVYGTLSCDAGDRYITQTFEFYYTNYGGYVALKRVWFYSDNVWRDWEWENPPMVVGTEYRTTERWKGSPVYAKALDVGYLAAGTHNIEHGCAMSQPISCHIYNNNQELIDVYSGLSNITVGRTTLNLICGNAFGNITVYLKYTK